MARLRTGLIVVGIVAGFGFLLGLFSCGAGYCMRREEAIANMRSMEILEQEGKSQAIRDAAGDAKRRYQRMLNVDGR